MKRLYRLALVIFILIVCTGCDQATKEIAEQRLSSIPPISILNDTIRLEYIENPGATLGLGANLPAELRFVVFVVIAGLALAAAIIFAVKTHTISLAQLAALSVAAAGGVGNLIDRVMNNGAVRDFVSLGIGPLRTGVFNAADVAILGGTALFLIFSRQPKAQTEEAAE